MAEEVGIEYGRRMATAMGAVTDVHRSVRTTMQAVADALSDWKGTIIFVSHDTEFVEALSPTKVLLMPDGQVDYFNEDWLELVSLA